MLTYRRMPSYLRFTASTPKESIRDTTTGALPTRSPGHLILVRESWNGTRRAGRARVRRRHSDAGPAVAERDDRALHGGRKDERRRAHGHALGLGARTCRPMDEGNRAAAATRRHPEILEPRGLPGDRRPATGSG